MERNQISVLKEYWKIFQWKLSNGEKEERQEENVRWGERKVKKCKRDIKKVSMKGMKDKRMEENRNSKNVCTHARARARVCVERETETLTEEIKGSIEGN
jgi:hypothetical protein